MKKLICTAEIRSVISDIDAKKGRAGADLICLGFLFLVRVLDFSEKTAYSPVIFAGCGGKTLTFPAKSVYNKMYVYSAQFRLVPQKAACGISVQSAEKTNGSSHAQALCGAALLSIGSVFRQTPGQDVSMKICKEIYQYRQMIFSLVKKDLRGRYKGSVLGFLWTFIKSADAAGGVYVRVHLYYESRH